jgi:hypothetical protein
MSSAHISNDWICRNNFEAARDAIIEISTQPVGLKQTRRDSRINQPPTCRDLLINHQVHAGTEGA